MQRFMFSQAGKSGLWLSLRTAGSGAELNVDDGIVRLASKRPNKHNKASV